MNSDKYKEGQRVIRVLDSAVPAGVLGTVLGRAPYPYADKWEVEYDNHPCTDYGRRVVPGTKSATSWFSREEAIKAAPEESDEDSPAPIAS